MFHGTILHLRYANDEQLILLIQTLVVIYYHETSSSDGAADISQDAHSFIEVILLQYHSISRVTVTASCELSFHVRTDLVHFMARSRRRRLKPGFIWFCWV